MQLECKSILFNRIIVRDKTKRHAIELRYASVERMSRKSEAFSATPAVIAVCGFRLENRTSTNA